VPGGKAKGYGILPGGPVGYLLPAKVVGASHRRPRDNQLSSRWLPAQEDWLGGRDHTQVHTQVQTQVHSRSGSHSPGSRPGSSPRSSSGPSHERDRMRREHYY
jgi:hypothetical protein